MEGSKHCVAIITGAGSGIGEETSYAFAKKGYSVVLINMNPDKMKKVVDNMKSMGISSDKILTMNEDLAEESSYESIINQTITKFGQIDVLVNNAGLVNIIPFEGLRVGIMDRAYKVMLRAPLFLSQKAFPHLKKTKGCIINVSSPASTGPLVSSMSYSITKAGLDHLTRCLALEGASYGVRVNATQPGIVRTAILTGNPYEEEIYKFFKERIPFGRMGTTSEMVSAIVFLASDAASYITGATLAVDGALNLATTWSGVTTNSEIDQ